MALGRCTDKPAGVGPKIRGIGPLNLRRVAARVEVMKSRISGFEDLHVYQEACSLDYAIFIASKAFPKEEMYSLTDQIRRASRSVGGNIAESWAKRRYPCPLCIQVD
jgi:hypothetical protein